MSAINDYAFKYETHLVPLEKLLEDYIREVLEGTPRVDNVTTRAKSPDRFEAKATKENEDGTLKYADPLTEIQDQLGARITVFYLTDVKAVSDAVLKYLSPIEIQNKQPINDYEFGYFGEHFILKIPDEVIPERSEDFVPEFFELQIKTLFQHAWSECYHDLGYKSSRVLTPLENRKAAFTAAQAWGADRIFQELADSLVLPPSESV